MGSAHEEHSHLCSLGWSLRQSGMPRRAPRELVSQALGEARICAPSAGKEAGPACGRGAAPALGGLW